MLTKKQIQQIAVRNNISLFPQERDYVQCMFLSFFFSNTKKAFFKGGTALRIIHKSNRYSEDLDFNWEGTIKELKELLDKTLKGLKLYGIEAEYKKERKFHNNLTLELRYKGPLYDGTDQSKGKIKIDFSVRKEKISYETVMVETIYDDLNPFFAQVLDLNHIFAEKIMALVIRQKPRDLYDTWFLLRKGIKSDLVLINKKLEIYEKKFSKKLFLESLEKIEKTWDSDMKGLLGSYPDFKQAKKDVLQKF